MNDVQTSPPEPDHTILVLTGPHFGKDIILGDYRFVQGRTVVAFPPSQCGGVIRYMSRCYQAYPEGSPELAAALERSGHGQPQTEANTEPRPTGEVRGDVQSPGNSPGPSAAEVIGRNDAGGAGNAGVHSEGGERSGSETAEGREAPVATPQAQSESKVGQALMMLDHGNDEHWTRDGRPAIAAVAAIAGQRVGRAMIDSIAPDFRRGHGEETPGSENQVGETAAVPVQ